MDSLTWEQCLEWSLCVLESIPVLPPGAFGKDAGSIPPADYITGLDMARLEVTRLKSIFQTLSADPVSCGIIHYDFETDNVFWQKDSNRCVPIDFDDVMVHWHLATSPRQWTAQEPPLRKRWNQLSWIQMNLIFTEAGY